MVPIVTIWKIIEVLSAEEAVESIPGAPSSNSARPRQKNAAFRITLSPFLYYVFGSISIDAVLPAKGAGQNNPLRTDAKITAWHQILSALPPAQANRFTTETLSHRDRCQDGYRSSNSPPLCLSVSVVQIFWDFVMPVSFFAPALIQDKCGGPITGSREPAKLP